MFTRRHALSVLVFFLLTLLPVPRSFASGGAFGGGNGSVATPYLIEDCTDLQAMNNDKTAQYALSGNIDCSATSGWNGGAGFVQIGNPAAKFTGGFNGRGYSISGLTINRTGTPYIGLFGWVNTSYTIKNVALTNANIAGGTYTAGFVGYLESGTLDKVSVTGTVGTGTALYNGGLVAYFQSGTLSNSYSRATIGASAIYDGGLVGLLDSGTIINCYSTGSVTSSSTGGLLGLNLFGWGTVSNSFYDTQTSGKSDTGNGTPKTTTEMKTLATFTSTATSGLSSAWDFTGNSNNDTGTAENWAIDADTNNGYPYLVYTDTAAPNVVSVSSDLVNGSYGAGIVVDIDVTFSEPVTSTGSVTVTLETGSTDHTCTFTVSSASSGTCNYIIQAGDTSSDLSVNSVTGTVTDSSGNVMSSTTPLTNLNANKDLVVDTTAPTYTFSSSVSSGANTTDSSIVLTVQFAESVTGFDLTDLSATNATLSNFTTVTAGTLYSVTVSRVNFGAVTISVAGSAASDAAANVTASGSFVFSFTEGGVFYVPQPSHHSKNSDTDPVIVCPFEDIEGSFAQDAIGTLYGKGVVQGVDSTHFAPDSFATRSQFLKMALLALQYSLPQPTDVSSFADVSVDAWYAPYVNGAAQDGLVSGYDWKDFKPEAEITRAEALKILLNVMGSSMENPKAAPFVDLTEGAWYQDTVSYAYILGLVQGRDATHFAPDAALTRGEAAVLLVRALGLTEQ